MSYNQFVERRSLAYLKEQREKRKTGGVNTVLETRKTREVPQYEVFKTTDLKDWSSKEFATSLFTKTNGAFKPTKSLLMPGSTDTWKFTFPDLRGQPDTTMYNLLAKEEAWANPYLELANRSYTSNGMKKGLSKRLVTKIKNFQKDIPKIPVGVLNYVKVHLPVKKDYEFVTDLNGETLCLLQMNMKADAGLPYAFNARFNKMLKVGDELPDGRFVLEDAIEDANKILKVMMKAPSLNDVPTFMFDWLNKPENMHFGVALLKRKYESMDREDFEEKVRPYAVYPLAIRVIGKYAIHPIEENLENFIENDLSSSAYHFSPFYGGAKKMVDWVKNCFKRFDNTKKINFFGLSYGDDQQWIFMDKTGRYVRCHPDYESMDLKTISSYTKYIAKFVIGTYPNAPEQWKRAVVFWATLLFRHYVHLGGPYVASKITGLFSGINGTTFVNIHNSTIGHGYIDDYVNKHQEENFINEFPKHLVNIQKMLFKQTGFVLKGLDKLEHDFKTLHHLDLATKYEESWTFGNVDDIDMVGMPLPFLGFKIINYELEGMKELLAVPYDMIKFVNSFVHPKSTYKGLANVRHRCERLMGVYMSGGWADPDLGKFIRKTYAMMVSQIDQSWSITPAEMGVIEQKDIAERMSQFAGKHKGLPDEEFMFRFNVLTVKENELLDRDIELINQLDDEEDQVSKAVPKGEDFIDVEKLVLDDEEIDLESSQPLPVLPLQNLPPPLPPKKAPPPLPPKPPKELIGNLLDLKVPVDMLQIPLKKAGNANANTFQEQQRKEDRNKARSEAKAVYNEMMGGRRQLKLLGGWENMYDSQLADLLDFINAEEDGSLYEDEYEEMVEMTRKFVEFLNRSRASFDKIEEDFDVDEYDGDISSKDLLVDKDTDRFSMGKHEAIFDEHS